MQALGMLPLGLKPKEDASQMRRGPWVALLRTSQLCQDNH